MALKPNQTILNKYKILAKIGRGSFGTVYRAQEVDTGHVVAIKELQDDLPAELAVEAEYRFANERKIGRKLDHPNIVKTYTTEQIEGKYYLVLEYMPGGSLRQILKKQGPLSIETAVRITRQICAALIEIHRRDLVHRDITPNNIMFSADGTAKLMDFGLVQEPGGSSGRSWGKGGTHPGAPAYKSPEAETQREYLKARSDIFMLGAVLFEMLTGQNYKTQSEGTPPSRFRSDVPRWLDTVTLKAVADTEQQRFQTAAEFADALQHRPHSTRSPWAIIAIVATLVLLVGAGSLGFARNKQTVATATEITSTTTVASVNTDNPPTATTGMLKTPVPPPTDTTIPVPPTSSPTVAPPQKPSTLYVEYIIDGSSGMMKSWTQDTEPKLASIQRTLPTFWQSTATEANIGLRAYGHRYPATDSQSCTDTQLLLPIRQWDSNTLTSSLYQIQAQGLDSLAESLRYAFGDFQYKSDRLDAVILLTEGGDTCGGNPLDIITAQKEIGINLPIYVIALEPSDKDISSLQSVAQESGGTFYTAYKAGDIYNLLFQIYQTLLSQKP